MHTNIHVHRWLCRHSYVEVPRLCCTMHTCGNGGLPADKQACVMQSCTQICVCLSMHFYACMYIDMYLCVHLCWWLSEWIPDMNTHWIVDRMSAHTTVYRHISEGMLSHGHMFIGEECKNACMCVCSCVCAHVFVCDMVGVKADYTCMIPSDKLLDSLSLTALSCKSGVLKAKFSALGTSLRLHWISTCMCGPYRK